MPWCDACDRFLSPSTVTVDGTCPSCGRVVDPGRARAAADTASEGRAPNEPEADDDALPRIPWHLWLLLAALVVYLGYRALEGIEWLLG